MGGATRETAETILVVDDLEPNRLVARGMLEDAGYRVIEAARGEDALVIAARESIDLVLLDLLMPGMDGFATCRAMRETPHGKVTPILFLTAVSDLQVHSAALDSGADDFLTKPIERIELLLRVRSLVRIKRLQVELGQANIALIAQRDALIEAALMRSRISAMVVHDLKSPLGSILGNARYVLETDGIPPDARDAAVDALGSAERMSRMVVDLLDIAQSAEGKIRPRVERVDLGALLSECVRAMQRAADERGHRLEVDVAPGITLMGDRDLLRRVIENLLDNAIGHAPPGTVVGVRAWREDADLMLRVADLGPGIPDERKPYVFEPYVQGDAGVLRERRRTSRGLGLAFCKLAVEAHRGAIWVEDNRPVGTAVCARLSDS
jgi:two-component system sensor histidine kinase/response regulator